MREQVLEGASATTRDVPTERQDLLGTEQSVSSFCVHILMQQTSTVSMAEVDEPVLFYTIFYMVQQALCRTAAPFEPMRDRRFVSSRACTPSDNCFLTGVCVGPDGFPFSTHIDEQTVPPLECILIKQVPLEEIDTLFGGASHAEKGANMGANMLSDLLQKTR